MSKELVTQQVSIQEKMYYFVKGDEWAHIKEKFEARIKIFDTIDSIDLDRPDADIRKEVDARRAVKTMLQQVIDEVQGEAEQYEMNVNKVPFGDAEIVSRFED